jgi:regulation of enolase protein 1 (concanavalin A-like superfamily)
VRRVGVLLSDSETGEWGAGLSASDGSGTILHQRVSRKGQGCLHMDSRGMVAGSHLHVRVRRRAGRVEWAYSEDGVRWTSGGVVEVALPKRLKVGVFAEAATPGSFEPVFDRLEFAKSGE